MKQTIAAIFVMRTPDRKKKMNKRLLALLVLIPLAGCGVFKVTPPPPPPRITGTVEDISYRFDLNLVSDLWSAQLLVSPDYNGAPNVNIANNGNSNTCFHDFIKDGDHLVITAKSSGSFNDLSVSDITVNGTPLSSYSCP